MLVPWEESNGFNVEKKTNIAMLTTCIKTTHKIETANEERKSHKRTGHTLPQGDFLTVNFKCLVGMRTGPLMGNACFLPAAIKDADAERMGVVSQRNEAYRKNVEALVQGRLKTQLRNASKHRTHPAQLHPCCEKSR